MTFQRYEISEAMTFRQGIQIIFVHVFFFLEAILNKTT